MKILLVEDSEKFRDKVIKIFNSKEREIDVLISKNGVEGIQMIKDNPDLKLAIVDFYMPQMDGMEMIRKLTDDNIKKPPIMFVTTEVSPNIREEGDKLGIEFWMLKPIIDDFFYDTVINIIDKKE
tara:strand:+ start:108 stop:482 length:375 start_codon:yes stop_codon:yes gene_type:complete